MSTELYYSVSNNDQATQSQPMSYSDLPLLNGARERQPSSHQGGLGPRGVNMYQQQQLQAALYQQQQIEFAQQQAQLEMHLQLEQMRLQNLALQEQIMLGQVQAQQQAQAQAHAENHLRNTLYASSKPPGSNRLNLTQNQGSLLAERALARRQQAEADALYHQYYPAMEEAMGGGPENALAHAQMLDQQSSRGSQSPPALVVSKPGEAFPVFAPAQTSAVKISPPAPKLTTKSQRQLDSESMAHTPLGVATPPGSLKLPNGADRAPSPAKAAPMVTPGKKFSEVVKSSPGPANKSNLANSASANAAAKLNPFSSVFVPGSAGSPDEEQGESAPAVAEAPARKSSAPSSRIDDNEKKPLALAAAPSSNVYRAPRSKSPPTSSKSGGSRSVSSPANVAPSQQMAGAMPTRQPRGPAAEAELTNQNFATRIRKRAIGAIKTLGSRPPVSPSLPPSPNTANFQYYQQQQHLLEALMVQQHQQQALAAAGYLDVDPAMYSSIVSPGGIAHLMATARAREERFGY